MELDGWLFRHIKGSHLIMTKQGAIRPVVFPADRKELSRHVLMSNLRTAGISHSRYLELIKTS